MAEVNYSVSNTEETQAAVVIIDGDPHTVGSTHPKYAEIVQVLYTEVGLKSEVDDEVADRLEGLISAETSINKVLTSARLSDRIILSGGNLLFDGVAQDGVIVDQIVRFYGEGNVSAYTALVRFLENLHQNPSEVSKEHAYSFLGNHGFTITEDGLILGHKSVRDDYLSEHQGAGIVTWPDGKVEEFENDHLPNNPGNIVAIPRVLVDESRDAHCSVGLHVGAYSYASTFSSKLLYVLVNPRDIVAVPNDFHAAKVRVSQYRVLADNEVGEFQNGFIANEELTTLTGVANVSEDVFPRDDDEDDINGWEPEDKDDEELAIVEDIYGNQHTGVLEDTLTPEDRKTVDELKTLVNSVVASGWTNKRTLGAYASKKLSKRRRPLWAIAVTELGLSLNN